MMTRSANTLIYLVTTKSTGLTMSKYGQILLNCSFSRTNNTAKNIQQKLNALLDIKSPRFTFLVHKFAILFKELVGKFVDQIGSPKKE